MKMHNIIWDPTAHALEKLVPMLDLTMDENKILRKFLRQFQAERMEGVQTYSKYKEKIDAKDPETLKQWVSYLSEDVEVTPLPSHFLSAEKCKGSLIPTEYMAAIGLFEEEPEEESGLKVVPPVPVEPSGATLD